MHRGVVCNPVLDLPEGRERRLDDSDEGCLSYPGAFVPCARPDWARVHGQGLDGEDVTYEGDGLLARCLQHETDHIHGTVFGDRLNDRARKKLRKQMEAAAEDYPPDWPVGEVAGADSEAAGLDGGSTDGQADG
jgi:peptide deformylase